MSSLCFYFKIQVGTCISNFQIPSQMYMYMYLVSQFQTYNCLTHQKYSYSKRYYCLKLGYAYPLSVHLENTVTDTCIRIINDVTKF
jgi:hypothetical protein